MICHGESTSAGLNLAENVIIARAGVPQHMGLKRLLVSRLIRMLVTLFAVLIITIALLGSTMDDILRRNVQQSVLQETSHDIRLLSRFKSQQEVQSYINSQVNARIHAQGLDEPWYSPKSLLSKLFRTMSLDLGNALFLTSDLGSQKVSNIILEKLPNTILLFTSSTLIITFIGLYLGAYSASRTGSLVDKFTSGSAIFSISVPTFFIGMMMIIVFAFIFPIFPSRATPVTSPSDPYYILDLLYHMILPLVTLVLVGFGAWAYTVRYYVINIFNEDFVAAKRAQGISHRKITYFHALKNAAPPTFTSIALSLSGSLGGAFLIEIVFNWPGMGLLAFNAISVMDIPVIIGLTYIATLIFVITMFVVDLMSQYFDPRVRIG
jgi:peptide/nickel transport system permease protein